MKQQNIQKKWLTVQTSLRETIYSTDKEIKLVFNGNVELIELSISNRICVHDLQYILPAIINDGIKKVSHKVQSEFIEFRKINGLK